MTTTDMLISPSTERVGTAAERPISFTRHPHDRTRGVVLEARSDDAVVGFASFDAEPNSPTGHVTVSVAPPWRNRHLGGELLRRAVQEAQGLGLDYLVGRYPADDVAASRVLAGSGCIVARRTGDEIVRFAIAVPRDADGT